RRPCSRRHTARRADRGCRRRTPRAPRHGARGRARVRGATAASPALHITRARPAARRKGDHSQATQHVPAAHPFIASPPGSSLPPGGGWVGGWIVAATAAALGALGGRAVIHFRTPPLGALEVRPAAMQLSIRVGDHVEFVASAPGAVETVWSLWGRRV